MSAKIAVQTGYPGACTNCFINLIGADNYVNEIVHCTQETKFIIDPNDIYIYFIISGLYLESDGAIHRILFNATPGKNSLSLMAHYTFYHTL